MNILESTNIQTTKSSINTPVLILNQDYSPLGICLAKRAIVLIFSEKAETVINSENSIKSISQSFLIPSVIKTLKYIKRPYEKKISRFGIFARDNFTCQYCNTTKNKLTIEPNNINCSLTFSAVRNASIEPYYLKKKEGAFFWDGEQLVFWCRNTDNMCKKKIIFGYDIGEDM